MNKINAIFLVSVFTLMVAMVYGSSIRVSSKSSIYKFDFTDKERMKILNSEMNPLKILPRELECNADSYGNGECIFSISTQDPSVNQVLKMVQLDLMSREFIQDVEDLYDSNFNSTATKLVETVQPYMAYYFVGKAMVDAFGNKTKNVEHVKIENEKNLVDVDDDSEDSFPSKTSLLYRRPVY